jgi:hypothetical protein
MSKEILSPEQDRIHSAGRSRPCPRTKFSLVQQSLPSKGAGFPAAASLYDPNEQLVAYSLIGCSLINLNSYKKLGVPRNDGFAKSPIWALAELVTI